MLKKSAKDNVETANLIVKKISKDKNFINSYIGLSATKQIKEHVKTRVTNILLREHNSGSIDMNYLEVNVKTDGSGTLCIWVDENNDYDNIKKEILYVN